MFKPICEYYSNICDDYCIGILHVLYSMYSIQNENYGYVVNILKIMDVLQKAVLAMDISIGITWTMDTFPLCLLGCPLSIVSIIIGYKKKVLAISWLWNDKE